MKSQLSKTPSTGKDSLYIPADGFRQSVPWKLRSDNLEQDLIAEELAALEGRSGRSYDGRGRLTEHEAFTEEEIEALLERVAARLAKIDLVEALNIEEIKGIAERFDFPTDALAALSKDLARALDTKITPVSIQLPRKKAIARAQKAMQLTAKDLMSPSEDLLRGFERLESLDTRQACDRLGANRFETLRKDYDQVLRDVETLHRKLSILVETPDSALDLRPSDKRAVADHRRAIVLSCLFTFWEASGHKLSLTNNSIQNRRAGPLIDFVNAVVRCITEPSSELSSETIHTELKLYKRSKTGA